MSITFWVLQIISLWSGYERSLESGFQWGSHLQIKNRFYFKNKLNKSKYFKEIDIFQILQNNSLKSGFLKQMIKNFKFKQKCVEDNLSTLFPQASTSQPNLQSSTLTTLVLRLKIQLRGEENGSGEAEVTKIVNRMTSINTVDGKIKQRLRRLNIVYFLRNEIDLIMFEIKQICGPSQQIWSLLN